MRREIKFRAWISDKMHDEIVLVTYKHCIEEEGMGCPLNEGIKDFLSHHDPDTPLILMQYTGLEDKNGKEAYWDDIVDDGINPPFAITPDYHLLAQLSEISFEIIGNTHENRGLLP